MHAPMGRMPYDYYRRKAGKLYEKPKTDNAVPAVESDVDVPVVLGTGGAWVMLWAWVPDPKEGDDESKVEDRTRGSDPGSNHG